jgi:Adenylate and Guanylate cyclase catalytic domain
MQIEAPGNLEIAQLPHGMNLQSCDYYLDVYASELLKNGYTSRKPTDHLIIVFVIFVCTSLVFVLYEILVTRRQNKVLQTAARTHQIVGSIFPEAVRDQIIKEQENAEAESKMKSNGPGFNLAEGTGRAGLRNFFSDALQGNDDEDLKKDSNSDEKTSKPIADLFPHTTIMFADINGFTAWSSVREPSQVFTLLETVYHGFDQIARARRVFKVETVGDCYVAVVGLPDPRNDQYVQANSHGFPWRLCLFRSK